MCPTRIRDIIMFSKKMFFICLILSCLSFSMVSAKSIVYVFAVEAWVPIPVKINSQEAFEMKGTPKGKDLTARFSACKKKCILNSEGKVIFSFEFSRINQATGTVYNYADEIQLNLSEGSVHYIQIKPKGFNDYTFKELSEKEANKLLNNKKCLLLPEYAQQ